MTALGKLTLVFVFLLAIAWFALTVVLFSTRNNWKVEAERTQKAATELANANNSVQETLRSERKANEDFERTQKANADRMKQMLDKREGDYKSLDSSYRKLLADQRKLEAAELAITAREQKLQNEIDFKNGILGKYEIELDTSARELQTAKTEREDARREENLQKRRAEQYADQVRSLSDIVAELKQSGATLKGNVRPVAPDGFRGTVERVVGNLVEFTPGSNTGLRANTKLTVYRDNPPKWIGYIQVTDQIDPDKSVGVFELPFNVKNPQAADLPRKGDLIIPATATSK